MTDRTMQIVADAKIDTRTSLGDLEATLEREELGALFGGRRGRIGARPSDPSSRRRPSLDCRPSRRKTRRGRDCIVLLPFPATRRHYQD